MRNKVLIVEDSLSFSATLREIIVSNHGFEVDIAGSLEETVGLIDQHGDEYFAATVDLNLPDAPDGEAIFPPIEKNIPTIVVTSSTDQSLQEDLWNKGIADYASKSGRYVLDYLGWMVKRIYLNQRMEVLVVDDSLVARKHMESILKTQAFKVHLANSGSNALNVINDNPNICLVIIDCYMDEMDGFELTARLKDIYPKDKLEIIGISAQGGKTLSAQFIKSGADDFIHKPFLPEEFICRVNHAVERIDNYRDLHELNKLKNQFIGTTAHDIRGPLGAIKTASDFLLQRDPSPEQSQKLAKMINNSSLDLLALLETLLDISVVENGVVKLAIDEVKVDKVIHERVELYNQEAQRKEIKVECYLDSEVSISADEIKIKQVIDNLLTNAIKYSELGGTIKVRLEDKIKSITLSVQDQGPGIPVEEQQHLFEAYKVLSSHATGGEKKTGLGLAITKNIIEAHKGKIYYVHDDEIHSTFYVELVRA